HPRPCATDYAMYEMAQEMKQKTTAALAALWEVPAEQIQVDGSGYSANGKRATVSEVAKQLEEAGVQITASVTVNPTGSGGAFATHVADVEVDPETGKVDVIRYTAVQD